MTYREIIEDLEKEIKEVKAFSKTKLGKFLEQFHGTRKFYFEVLNENTFNKVINYLNEYDVGYKMSYFTSRKKIVTSIRIDNCHWEVSVYFFRSPEDFESSDCHVVKIPTEDISLVCDKEN